MDITLKTQITGVHIWLPLDEAVKFCKAPRRVQEQVRIMLKAGNVDLSTGETINPLRTGFAMGARPGSLQAKREGIPETGVPCPYCEKWCKNDRGLSIHIKRSPSCRQKQEGASVDALDDLDREWTEEE